MTEVATIEQVHQVVAAYARLFDPSLVSPADAQRVVDKAAAAENMLAMVKARAAARVAETELWRQEGDPSPAHHLARRTGTSVSKAREALETAGALPSLPELDAAARRGEVSPAQAGAIADAATKNPRAEGRLLDRARRASLAELLDECARTKAAAARDAEERHRMIHAGRHLRRRRCADGSAELSYRSTPEEVAEVFSVVRGYAEQIFKKARGEGRREAEEAYLADGVLAAARAAHSGTVGGRRPPTPSKVLVRVDWDALVRGWPADGERCEIAGLGPVAVSAVRAMVESGDAFLAAVVTRGNDVATVAHLGRQPTAFQRTALEWLNPTCAAEGCHTGVRLEADHRVNWSKVALTQLANLDLLCAHHHDLKTYSGWALAEGTGKRPMVGPEDARHPATRLPVGAGAGPP